MKRQKHTAALKYEVALAAIKGELTQAQITSRYRAHATQINRWKKQALEVLKAFFGGQLKVSTGDKYDEQLQSQLYEEIGRLKVELSWLKKKSEFNA